MSVRRDVPRPEPACRVRWQPGDDARHAYWMGAGGQAAEVTALCGAVLSLAPIGSDWWIAKPTCEECWSRALA